VVVCPRCGTSNQENARFCLSCGEALRSACPECGEPLPGLGRFCPSCGAELAAGPITEERRKVVSILFADLVGFTSRSELDDPEDVRARLRQYHQTVRAPVERFGGIVEKFVGDAVMAVFGAPIAHGDDAERAVRAALAIPHAVEQLNRKDPGLDLQVRVAVNTGEAVVTMDAHPGEGEAMVAGDVVNTASRLQTAAPVGGVLVGEGTFLATRRAIRYEPVDAIEAKGKREPVPAWIAVEPLAPFAGMLLDSDFVGRTSELDLLDDVWMRATDEARPHIITVLGEPGIGKSRLASELARRVERGGGRAFHVRSLPYELSAGYEAFGELVREAADIYETDSGEVAREKLAAAVVALGVEGSDLSTTLPVFVGAGEVEVEHRKGLFEAGRRFVEALARDRPTLIVFEDIHWAHPSALDLIQYLAARARGARLLLLALARPELLDLRPEWGGGLAASTTIRLEPLSDEDSHTLTSRLLEQHSHEDAQRIEATAGGNPLFIEELAAWVHESGGGDSALPSTVRAMIAARLDALPENESQVLYDASILGLQFWVGPLAQLGSGGEALVEILDSLEERDLIRGETESVIEGDREFSFRHILIRDVAYETLPRAGRRQRHEVVARFMEQTVANPDAHAAILAHHWREAGDPVRALDYLLLAAAQAEKGWATNEAVQLYDDALTLVPKEDAERLRAVGTRRAVAALRFQHYVSDLKTGGTEPGVEEGDP
jgi:class 3 adenylate cyclase